MRTFIAIERMLVMLLLYLHAFGVPRVFFFVFRFLINFSLSYVPFAHQFVLVNGTFGVYVALIRCRQSQAYI